MEFLSLGEVVKSAIGIHLVDHGHFFDSFTYRGEVCKHTARPTFRNIRHVDCGNRLRNDVLGLLLRSDEQDAATALGDLLERGGGFIDLHHRFVKVDDVDSVFLHEDIRSHLGIPLSLEVAEVSAGLQ